MRARRAGAVLAVLLLAYALAGFYLVPRIARAQLEAFASETLHRKVSVGEIRFNPFTLAADVAQFRLAEADGTALVSFRHLHVNAELASLWRRGLVFREIDLDGPDIEVIVAPDGTLNLARLAPPSASPREPDEAGAHPLRVHIGRFAVTEGRVGFQDRSLAQPFSAAFTPIRFSLTDFRTDVGHRNAYSFSTSSRIGARFEWAGGFTVQPPGSSGTFRVTDLRLAAIDDYLESKLPVEFVSGSVGLDGSYRFDLQPLTLEATLPLVSVRDLVLAERGAGTPPPVAIPEIDVQQLAVSLARRDVGMQALIVRGARIELKREADGSFNLARLAPAPGAPAEAKAAADRPWTVHADAIRVEGASVLAEDRGTSPAARLRLSPLDATLAGWTTAAGARMKLETRIGIDKEARLAVAGDLGLAPFSAALAIDLQRFPLPVLQPYLSRSTALTLHSGSLGAKASLALAAARDGKAPAARVAGELRIDNLRASDDLVREDLLKWRSLLIAGIRFQQHPDRLHIDRIVAQEPYARVIIAQNGTTNLARALTPPEGAAPGATPGGAPPARPLPIAIRMVQVADGSANFADYAIQPSFATGIVALNGQVEGLSSAPESRAKVAIKGRVDEYSPVEISGSVNLLSAAVYTDLAMSFRNIELTAFNPYSGKFAGYHIAKGKLSTGLKYRVEDRKLDAQHHIVLDNLEFGDATDSKDAAPIPIKLGVALLKDKRGVIELDLPVSGTLDDPEFRLMPIIWKGIVNLLAKIIAAPFKALGALFGGGEDLAFVDFDPGSAALGEAQAKKLGALASGLVERPELRLSVPLAVAAAADGDAIARHALRALVPPLDPATPLDDEAKRGRSALLETAYKARLGSAPAYPAELQGPESPKLDARIGWLEAALLADLKPAPAGLEALGRQRAGAVRDMLLSNTALEPERVFLVAQQVDTAPPEGRVPMEMKLE